MKFFMLLILSFPILAQNHTEKFIEEFMKQRKAMVEEINKAFEAHEMEMDKIFNDEDFLKGFRSGNMSELRGFRGIGPDFTIEERTTEAGEMAIFITPKNKNVTLDIQTHEDRISISSETKVEEETKDKSGNVSSSYSSSSYTRSIGIPFGYKAEDPKAEGESVVIVLKKLKETNNGRVPIKKGKDEETL